MISSETYRICDCISTDLYVTHLYRSSSGHDDLDSLARNGDCIIHLEQDGAFFIANAKNNWFINGNFIRN